MLGEVGGVGKDGARDPNATRLSGSDSAGLSSVTQDDGSGADNTRDAARGIGAPPRVVAEA